MILVWLVSVWVLDLNSWLANPSIQIVSLNFPSLRWLLGYRLVLRILELSSGTVIF